MVISNVKRSVILSLCDTLRLHCSASSQLPLHDMTLSVSVQWHALYLLRYLLWSLYSLLGDLYEHDFLAGHTRVQQYPEAPCR